MDDGSTDATAAIVEERAASEPRLRLLRNPGNRGKGYAVRTRNARSQRAIGFCPRMPTSPRPSMNFPSCSPPPKQQGAAIAIGSRALDRTLIGVHQSQWREMSGIVFNGVMRLITGLAFCRYAVRLQALPPRCRRPCFQAPAPGWLQLRRRGFVYRAHSEDSCYRSPGALEQCRRNQGQPVARDRLICRPAAHSLELVARPLHRLN